MPAIVAMNSPALTGVKDYSKELYWQNKSAETKVENSGRVSSIFTNLLAAEWRKEQTLNLEPRATE
jgi:hypothetical protein